MMKSLRTIIMLIAGIIVWSSAASMTLAFGPYENHLAQGKDTYVGLIAAAKPGKEADLDKALKCLVCDKCVKALKKSGIANVSAYKKILTDKKTWYWVYFDYKGKDYLKAVNAFEKVAAGAAEFVEPHPRAKAYATSWLQMEWICYIRGVMDKKVPAQNKIGVVTRVNPEKEQFYRTLHQAVWPGVIDQITRSNNRDLSIFLVEIGDEIYEFLYLEYLGKDAAADDKSSKSDPCTLRWWKLTDACQIPLPEVKEGVWAGMEAVIR